MKIQRIGVKGRRFGFKAGNTFLAVKEYGKGKLSFAVARPMRYERRTEKAVRAWMRKLIAKRIASLTLIAALVLSVHGQELISADGTEWTYIATGRDKDKKQFNVFARRIENPAYPELEIKFGHEDRVRAEHNCKTRTYRLKGGQWTKPVGSVGAKLIAFACKK